MTKLEMLIIRACKAQDAELRLESIYRRFYNGDVSDCKHCFTSKLIEIQQTYGISPLKTVITNIRDFIEYDIICNNPTSDVQDMIVCFNYAIYSALISAIRYTSVEQYKDSGFIQPKRFRN